MMPPRGGNTGNCPNEVILTAGAFLRWFNKFGSVVAHTVNATTHDPWGQCWFRQGIQQVLNVGLIGQIRVEPFREAIFRNDDRRPVVDVSYLRPAWSWSGLCTSAATVRGRPRATPGQARTRTGQRSPATVPSPRTNSSGPSCRPRSSAIRNSPSAGLSGISGDDASVHAVLFVEDASATK